MGALKLLDCTLRDGGYVNDWNFGESAIEDMVRKLEQTRVEILELGFIKDEPYNKARTVFNDIKQVKKLIAHKVLGLEYAVMAEVVNPLPLEKLAPADADGPEIIRVIVWKRMLKEGFEYCKGIVEKGYKLCVQPARVSQYSDEEFLEMIEMFNQLDPMAIYVVDSWGTMYADALLHYMKLADAHLKPDIAVGYHGHNNMMQAFDVACAFARQKLTRDVIIDASIYGIGRGAGNLNLELFTKYLNDTMGRTYELSSMMYIYDKYIKKIYYEHPWGFSPSYFISAEYNCNPNFVEYYERKKLTAMEIEESISSIPYQDRIIFKHSVARKYGQQVKRKYWKNKLAIILITANRPNAVKGFLNKSIHGLYEYGIDLIVYDSSDNNETQNLIMEKFKNFENIIYDRWDGIYNGISIDEKVIDAYKKYYSKYEYLWQTRDGNAIYIFGCIPGIHQLLNSNYDIIVVDHFTRDYRNIGCKIYDEPQLFFADQCAQMQTLGTIIVKSSRIIDIINENPLNDKNFSLWQPISFFYFFSSHKIKAASWVGLLWCENKGASTSSFWSKNFLWQWSERWYDMIQQLPDIYNPYKESVLKLKTIDFQPFSAAHLAKMRANGGFSFKDVFKYRKYFPYVCDTQTWKFFVISLLPRSLAPYIIRRIRRFGENYIHHIDKHWSKKKRSK